jgi:hypothetical protein
MARAMASSHRTALLTHAGCARPPRSPAALMPRPSVSPSSSRLSRRPVRSPAAPACADACSQPRSPYPRGPAVHNRRRVRDARRGSGHENRVPPEKQPQKLSAVDVLGRPIGQICWPPEHAAVAMGSVRLGCIRSHHRRSSIYGEPVPSLPASRRRSDSHHSLPLLPMGSSSKRSSPPPLRPAQSNC